MRELYFHFTLHYGVVCYRVMWLDANFSEGPDACAFTLNMETSILQVYVIL
jgi:hypothetical protein